MIHLTMQHFKTISVHPIVYEKTTFENEYPRFGQVFYGMDLFGIIRYNYLKNGNNMSDGIRWVVRDRYGNEIYLTHERWHHIAAKQRERYSPIQRHKATRLTDFHSIFSPIWNHNQRDRPTEKGAQGTMQKISFALILFLSCFALQPEAAEIYAGLAKADMTPPIGGRTTGYSSAKPTDGIHDPLFIKVLYLQMSDQNIAIVTWDSCVFTSPWLHEQMPEIGIDHLLLLNTHTHAGPNLNQKDFPSEEKPWRRTVEERTLKAIQEAKQNLFPAHFTAGQGSIQLGYNRLVRQPEGYSITHFENPERIPYGPVDPTVGIIRITDNTEKIRAVIVNYACHPVVLGPRNRKISADFPGVMRDEVEKEIGGDVECIFVQGGCGEINPLILARTGNPEEDFPLVENMGKLLAEEVLDTLHRMEGVKAKSDQLSCNSKQMTVKSRWEKEETIDVGVTSILLNNEIGIVTMPGEPFQKFQADLREKADLPHTFFFGYCDDAGYDWTRYIPDVESAARGGYGASDATHVAVGTGERLINEGIVMLYEMRDMLKEKPQRHIHE